MPESQPERTLGSYRLIERVGVGGMGVVYRAQHQRLGRQAAVKVLPEVLATDPKFLRRFEREATNAAALQHPNILPVWEFGEENGVPYLVMPYITGGTLRDRLANGPLSPQMALTYLRQIAEALDYAHRQGIIHRDVKPANLLIDQRGRLYLADFGIAKALERTEGLTHTGMGVGTVEYMAPEQAQGEAEARSDLYALGIILYEMLVGRVPYSGKSNVEILLKHLQTPLPLIPLRQAQPNVSAAIEGVLERALAKRPDDRFQSGKALADALAEALAPSTHAGDGAEMPPDSPTLTGIGPLPNTNPPTLEGERQGYGNLPPLAATSLGTGTHYPSPHATTPPPTAPPGRPTLPPAPTPLGATPRPPTYATPPPGHTPPPQSPDGPVAPRHGGPPTAGGSNRLLLGVVAGGVVALLVLLVGIGAIVLVKRQAAASSRATTPARVTPSSGIVAGGGVTPSPTSPTPTPSSAAATTPFAGSGPSASPPTPSVETPTTRPPTATATRPATPPPAPRGAAPAGWKTYTGTAKVPFAIFYPPDWTIDERAANSGQVYLRPPTGGAIWMLVSTTGRPEPDSNIDVLRAQYYDTGLTDCLQKAIDRTNYPEFSGITFAGLGATCETADGLNYARIGLGLKESVPWVYRLNAPYGQYTDLLNRYFQAMLNSLNIYANP